MDELGGMGGGSVLAAFRQTSTCLTRLTAIYGVLFSITTWPAEPVGNLTVLVAQQSSLNILQRGA